MFLSFRVSTSSQRVTFNQITNYPPEDISAALKPSRVRRVVIPKRTRPASIAAIPCACTALQIHDQAYLGAARLFRFMIRHILEQYNEYQILRSWSNRSRLGRAGTAMAQTPTVNRRP